MMMVKYLGEDVIVYTFKEEYDPLPSDQLERDLTEEELNVELDSLPSSVHLDSLSGGTKSLSFDQNPLLVDL